MGPEAYNSYAEDAKFIVKNEPPESIEETPLHIIDEIYIKPLDEFIVCQVCESTEDLIDVTLEVRYQEELRKLICIQSERVARKLKYVCQECGHKIDKMIQFRKKYEGTFSKLFEIIQRKQLETEAVVLLEQLIIPNRIEESTAINPSIDDQSEVEKESKLDILIGKQSNSKFNLNDHLQTYKEDKPYKCHICSSIFYLRNALKSHMLKHLKAKSTKRYKCTECPKDFSRFQGLTRHKLIHTGEKPYKCAHCTYCTCHSYNLAKHMSRVHKTEKSHKCKQCLKGFNSLRYLKYHMHSHTGKPYRCTHCSAGFILPYQLKQHILRHS